MKGGLRTALPAQGGALDALWRTALRLGFRVARQWWRLRRPDHEGALVAIWLAGQVLVVRQSYRPELSLPGGGVKRGEAPRTAACRELREELGLHVTPEQLVPVAEVRVFWDYRRDCVHVFDLHLSAPPAIAVDRREVVAAQFMKPDELLHASVVPALRARLAPAA